LHLWEFFSCSNRQAMLRQRCRGLALRLLLVGGAAAAIGPALRLVGGGTAVGQAFCLLLLPAAGLLQDLWLLSWLAAPALASSDGDAAPCFMLVNMHRRRNSSPT
jgi:hypothetical protein